MFSRVFFASTQVLICEDVSNAVRSIDDDIRNCSLAAANELIPEDARRLAKKSLKEKEKIRATVVLETLQDVRF